MSEATDNAETVEGTVEAPAAETVVTDRPEWLPEKFKSAEDMATAYSSLESKLGKDQETLKSALLEEIQNEALADRPESAGDYQLKEGYEEFATDPLMEWWSNFAWTNGFSQEEFDEGLEQFTADGIDMDAEVQKLGDNGNARIEAAALWFQKHIPEKFAPVLERIGESAEGVELVEFLMEMTSQQSMSGDATAPTTLTKAELEEKMRDPRYWNPTQRDNNFVKEVTEGFAKISR